MDKTRANEFGQTFTEEKASEASKEPNASKELNESKELKLKASKASTKEDLKDGREDDLIKEGSSLLNEATITKESSPKTVRKRKAQKNKTKVK